MALLRLSEVQWFTNFSSNQLRVSPVTEDLSTFTSISSQSVLQDPSLVMQIQVLEDSSMVVSPAAKGTCHDPFSDSWNNKVVVAIPHTVTQNKITEPINEATRGKSINIQGQLQSKMLPVPAMPKYLKEWFM